MSHRVDVKSKIDNTTVLENALRELKWAFKAEGDSYQIPHLTAYGITAQVNVKTGDIIVDSMKTREIESLKQMYAVNLVKYQAGLRGDTIESINTLQDGTIRLIVRTG
jgi:hypothetical protein